MHIILASVRKTHPCISTLPVRFILLNARQLPRLIFISFCFCAVLSCCSCVSVILLAVVGVDPSLPPPFRRTATMSTPSSKVVEKKTNAQKRRDKWDKRLENNNVREVHSFPVSSVRRPAGGRQGAFA